METAFGAGGSDRHTLAVRGEVRLPKTIRGQYWASSRIRRGKSKPGRADDELYVGLWQDGTERSVSEGEEQRGPSQSRWASIQKRGSSSSWEERSGVRSVTSTSFLPHWLQSLKKAFEDKQTLKCLFLYVIAGYFHSFFLLSHWTPRTIFLECDLIHIRTVIENFRKSPSKIRLFMGSFFVQDRSKRASHLLQIKGSIKTL